MEQCGEELGRLKKYITGSSPTWGCPQPIIAFPLEPNRNEQDLIPDDPAGGEQIRNHKNISIEISGIGNSKVKGENPVNGKMNLLHFPI
jgi:hypothetical protein